MKFRIVLASLIVSLSSNYCSPLLAQSDSTSVVAAFDDLVTRWDLLASDLGSYEGLNRYCTEKQYQDNVISILEDIHHYDSVLYDVIARKARFSNNSEMKKTLNQIEEFETEFKGPSFMKKLYDECAGRREIEKSREETRNDIGMNSYDGQVAVLEADLHKYVAHITKLMDHIKEHVHHLHIE